MTDTDPRVSAPPDEDVTVRLLRLADAPPAPASWREARVRAAVRAEWQAGVRRRRARRRAIGAIAVAAAASLALAVVWWTRPDRSLPGGAMTVATVDRIEGVARLALAGDAARQVTLLTGGAVRAGEAVATSTDARVALRFADGTSVRLDTSSRIRLLSEEAIELTTGAVYVDTGDELGRFTVQTPLATARDIGTRFEVRLIDRALRLRVRSGAVVLTDAARTVTAGAGTELVWSEAGVHRRPIPGDVPWAWVASVAPPVDFEGLTLAEFLSRVAREEDWTVRYEDAALARDAAGIVLHGSASGLSARDAVGVSISASGLTHRFEDRTIVVLRASAGR